MDGLGLANLNSAKGKVINFMYFEDLADYHWTY